MWIFIRFNPESSKTCTFFFKTWERLHWLLYNECIKAKSYHSHIDHFLASTIWFLQQMLLTSLTKPILAALRGRRDAQGSQVTNPRTLAADSKRSSVDPKRFVCVYSHLTCLRDLLPDQGLPRVWHCLALFNYIYITEYPAYLKIDWGEEESITEKLGKEAWKKLNWNLHLLDCHLLWRNCAAIALLRFGMEAPGD